ncbi:hypothetical protein C8034_v005968 [Colletotrichum sidae]|uniref:Uncharacterized protein n=2 Tax=Colletotrichum orbiculare species complex TaxID=2707354 RepID=A0A484F9K9_COLOR|nr:hypothetical protein Cob_v012121 [Colletotrichum orbiculare MAFF 240422]TEA12521.1 hypothetical protein C8034_v005968 [Colletotrichum sidae]
MASTQHFDHNRGSSTPLPRLPITNIEANNMFPPEYRNFDSQANPHTGLWHRLERTPVTINPVLLARRLKGTKRANGITKSSSSATIQRFQTAISRFSQRLPRHLTLNGKSSSPEEAMEHAVTSTPEKVISIERATAAKIYLETY